MQPLPEISVIICTYNRAEMLGETLACLLSHYSDRFLEGVCEIVVVNNNSTDHTEEVVDLFRKKNPFIKYVVEKMQGLSHARNRGIAESSGKWLVFLDDDVYVEQEWLDALIAPLLRDDAVQAVGGRVVPYKVDIPEWLPGNYFFLAGIIDLGTEEKMVTKVPGGNCVIRKSCLRDVGNFNTTLGRKGNMLMGGEETELCQRIIARKGKISYAPRAVIYHKIESKLNRAYLLDYALMLGRSEVIQEKKHTPLRFVLKYLRASLVIVTGYYRIRQSIAGSEKQKMEYAIKYMHAKGYLA